MAGLSATTTVCRKSWCLRRNTAATGAKRSVFAPTKRLLQRHFLLTGRRMEWHTTTEKTFPSATVTVCSLPFTDHGIGPLTHKQATT